MPMNFPAAAKLERSQEHKWGKEIGEESSV